MIMGTILMFSIKEPKVKNSEKQYECICPAGPPGPPGKDGENGENCEVVNIQGRLHCRYPNNRTLPSDIYLDKTAVFNKTPILHMYTSQITILMGTAILLVLLNGLIWYLGKRLSAQDDKSKK
jgi:hypothetical protein